MKQFLVLCAILLSGSCTSQSLFVVYDFKGKVYRLRKAAPIPLKIGVRLNENDSVMIPHGSSLVLVCNNFGDLRLNKPGRFRLKSLLPACMQTAVSPDRAYWQYVWHELTTTHGRPEDDRRNFMANYGGAIRGDCSFAAIPWYLDTVRFVNQPFSLRWKPLNTGGDVTINVYAADNPGSSLRSLFAQGDSLDLDKNIATGLQPGYYTWMLARGTDECRGGTLFVNDASSFTEELSVMHAKFETGLSPEEVKFRIAYVLEKQHYYSEAYAYYRAALNGRPDHPLYRNAVINVKQTYGF